MGMVRFAGQTIETGLCWSSDDHCGALASLATGFNVWRYFKNLDNFAENSKVARFKNDNGDVLFAIAYRSINDTDVTLYYQYADQDTVSGVINYLSGDIDYDTMQSLGFWSGEGSPYYHVYKKDGLYNDDEYRSNVYFYYYDWSMALMDYHGTGPNVAEGSMTIFNGYSLAGGTPEPIEEIDINLGMIYPDDSTTIIPDIDKPVYPYNGQSTSHDWLPDLLNNTEVEIISSYEQDESHTGGGGGRNYGYGGEPIDFWDIPGLSVLDTGFVNMYNPTAAELRALGSFMWSSNFIDNILKLLQDPIEAIIQVGIVPLDLSSFTTTHSDIMLGNVNTAVQAAPLTQQVIPVDMGSITIPENWTNALDYAPFTKIELYLPFIGFIPLSTSEVMDSKITLRYYVDLLSGDCVAALKVDKVSKNGVGLHSVMYHYRGNMLLNIPVTGKNYSAFYASILTSTVGAMAGPATSMLGGALASGVAGATSMMNSTPSMNKSGSFSGASGWIGCYYPYISIDRPIQQLPGGYSKYKGYPSFIRRTISELKGYTQVEELIDNTVKATDAEKQEIDRLLKEGIII